MKKRIFAAVLTICLVLALALPCFAENAFILDYALLLTEDEAGELEAVSQDCAEKYGVGIYILTVDSMDGLSQRDFAEQFYLDNGLGVGESSRGAMFMISMGERKFVTITYGWAGSGETNPFSDFGVDETETEITPFLSDGDYYEAFSRFVNNYAGYLSYLDTNGYAYDQAGYDANYDYIASGDVYEDGNSTGFSGTKVLIAAVVSAIIAFIVCAIQKGKMKSAKKAEAAGDYIASGSITLNRKEDNYTHSTEVRTKIESESSSGGGSSTDSKGFGGSDGGSF